MGKIGSYVSIEVVIDETEALDAVDVEMEQAGCDKGHFCYH